MYDKHISSSLAIDLVACIVMRSIVGFQIWTALGVQEWLNLDVVLKIAESVYWSSLNVPSIAKALESKIDRMRATCRAVSGEYSWRALS